MKGTKEESKIRLNNDFKKLIRDHKELSKLSERYFRKLNTVLNLYCEHAYDINYYLNNEEKEKWNDYNKWWTMERFTE